MSNGENGSSAENTAANLLLTQCIEVNDQLKEAKKVVEDLEEKMAALKEQVKTLFIEIGVKSLKIGKVNVYLSKQLWAGIVPEVSKEKLADALLAAKMEDYISCNAQKLSSYVREISQEHPEFFSKDGTLIATTDQIAAVLPEPFNEMVRVTEKVDIRIRK